MASPIARQSSGAASTVQPITNGELVDIDFLNAGALVIARKTTAKDVATNVEADLLNGEFTLPANLLGTQGLMRLSMWGDCLFNNGIQSVPRWKFKMGAGPTTLLDTNTIASLLNGSATRGAWRAVVEVMNLGSASTQLVYLTLSMKVINASGNTADFAVGQGTYECVLSKTTGTLMLASGYGPGAINTAVDQAVQFTVLNPTSTSYDVQLLGAIMEIV